MATLLDALHDADLLSELPLPASGELAVLSADAVSTTTPFEASLALGPFSGTIRGATVGGNATSARVTLPLTGLVLTAHVEGASLTVNGAPVVTLEIGPKGLDWTLSGPIVLTPDSGAVTAGPGGAAVSLTLLTAALRIVDGAPALGLTGAVTVGGLPSAGPPDLRFTLVVGPRGVTGSADRTVGPVNVSLGWSEAGGLLPSSIDVSTPFTPPRLDVPDAVPDVGRSVVRARLARDTGGYHGTIAVESGEEGVLSYPDPGVAAAAVLVTATVGDTAPAATDPNAAELAALAATARHFITTTDGPHLTRVIGVRFDPATPGRARIDYRAELSCEIQSAIVRAKTVSPMRVVVRDAVLDCSEVPRLSFQGASIDVCDTGRWEVTQPSGLLQVVGVRSGHGSSFFELELRLTFDLGPIRSAGAVLRVSLNDHTVSLQGFSLSVDVPGLVSGEGRLSFGEDGGFSAALRVELTPLNLAAAAGLTVEPTPEGARSILATLAVGLPAPVPLANSGLGLFGIEAILGLNRTPVIGESLPERLAWRPDAAHTKARLALDMFGAGVAVGTLPDLGFAFSALGRVVVRTPDFGLLVALDATVLSPPRDVTRPTGGASVAGMTGLLSIDSDELYAGVTGRYHFPPDDPEHPGGWHLLRIDVPAETRYPLKPDRSAWTIHLGAAPGYGAPIRALLLPELFSVGAEAFLMLHGNGFSPPLPGLTASPAAGFAAAAGFSFTAKYGVPPVWAELSADAVVAFGSRPVFVAGEAGVHGSLHLGPFSLGLDATLKMQLGPGDGKLADLHACGSIDLWLFEISGCVHLRFGESTPFEPDPPSDPLVSATVADCTGVAVSQGGELADNAADAPAMWPDGVVLLGFAPGPAYAGPAGEPFHRALDPASTPPGPGTGAAPDGTIGSPGYPGRWTLTGVGFQQWDNGVGTPITQQLPACWQRPPGVPPNVPTTGRVLALLTHDPALWSRSLIDGGAGDPADPVAQHGRDCAGDWPAARGWAVGGPAVPDGTDWRLPSLIEGLPAQGPVPATTATVRATATTVVPAVAGLGHVPAVPSSAPLLPPGTALIPAGPPNTDPVTVSWLPADFPGLLPLADLAVTPFADDQDVLTVPEPARTTLTLTTPLASVDRTGVAPTLVLWSRTGFRGVEVTTETHGIEMQWTPAHTERVLEGVLGIFEWLPGTDARDPLATVTIRHAPFPAGGRTDPALAVVAIGGVTAAAANASDHARDSGKSALAERHKPRGLLLRDLFEENRTYRLDVTWKGTIDGDSLYSGTTDSRYLRIAPHVAAAPPPEALYRDVTRFHPAMLGRYLKGYSVHGDTPVFFGDELCVTFSTDTVPMVARVYGYVLDVAVDRTDPPPGWVHEADPRLRQLMEANVVPSVHPERLDPVDRRGVAAAVQACAWPVTATDAVVTPVLVADACYDLAAVLVPRAGPSLPGRVRTALPHVSFRTSHWRSAPDLFKDLGFGGTATGVRHLAVRSAVADPGENSDGALRDALDKADAEPGPLDAPARTTVLWVRDGSGGHAVGALLLEAVEPLVRTDRLDRLGMTGFTTRTDRAATSVLLVPPAPIPAGPLTLTWQERDPKTAVWSSAAATLVLPAPATVPALALEVWP
ncbi:hypothetical protein [Streptomyces sp. NPDC056194]|uniref:hypothetical protein n=1 Tax=unclassified Streptomyces TaxID=2593676 RepID=UPI0035DD279C